MQENVRWRGRCRPRPRTSSLWSAANGRTSRGAAVHRLVEQGLEPLEEPGRAVGERVGPQGSQRQGGHPAQAAPDRRLDGQEQVPPGKIDRLVGRLRPGDALAAGAPVGAIDVGGRLVEQDRRIDPIIAHCAKEPAQGGDFRVLPAEPGPDVDGHDSRELAEQIDAQDGAVESSAHQRGGRDLLRLTHCAAIPPHGSGLERPGIALF